MNSSVMSEPAGGVTKPIWKSYVAAVIPWKVIPLSVYDELDWASALVAASPARAMYLVNDDILGLIFVTAKLVNRLSS